MISIRYPGREPVEDLRRTSPNTVAGIVLAVIAICCVPQPASADASAVTGTGVTESPTLGQTVEQYRVPEEPRTAWVKDPADITDTGDKLAVRKVVDEEANTVKLQNVIPPIHFESGKVAIPKSYIGKLQKILDSVKQRTNVRPI